MARDNNDINDFEYELGSDEEFSLESILAEYKGSAYIDGDKRTPSEILEAKTEKIISEEQAEETGDYFIQEKTERFEKEEATPAGKRKSRRKKSRGKSKKDTENAANAANDYFADIEEKFKPDDDDFFADIRDGIGDNVAPKHRNTSDDGLEKKFAATKPNNGNKKVLLQLDKDEPDETTGKDMSDQGIGEKKPARSEVAHDKVVNFRDFSVSEKKDVDDEFFDTYGYSDPNAVGEKAEEVSDIIDEGERQDAEEKKARKRWFFAPKEPPEIDDEFDDEDYVDEEDEFFEEEVEEEPDYLEESKRFAKGIRFLSVRACASFVVCVLMLVFTFIAESGGAVPFGIGSNMELLSGVMMIMLLVVMLFGVDIIVSGVDDIFKGQPGAESLIFVACFITLLSSGLSVIKGNFDLGIPFCVIPACSLFFGIRGRRYYKMAMCDALRVAVAKSSPYGVVSEYGSLGERSVLKKITTSTEGFYRKLSQADVSEDAYGILSPLLMIMSLVLALLVSFGRGQSANFGYAFAAMLSVSTSFSALIAYSMPFKFVSQMSKRSGGAVAGWGGAAEIFDSDGALVTDEDIFPTGTLSISGIKLFEGVSQNMAIAYTSSLVIASGSDLAKTFAELLKTQKLEVLRIDEFACYEGGGVGGIINGDRVMMGTSGFMNLMGIRVPENVNIKNSVFTAVNDELIGVFTINYVPANSVQGALVSMLKTRTDMLFALRDFNITPMMLQQKFKVSMKKIETVSIEDCYKVSTGEPLYDNDAVAVLCREGLGPFADVVTRGRQLKIISHLATVLTAIGSVFGLILIFFLCWSDAYDAVTPGNAFVFMIAIHFVIAIFIRLAKRRS